MKAEEDTHPELPWFFQASVLLVLTTWELAGNESLGPTPDL